jgi:N-hydroxyarylamine O-acetyltransferase
MARVHRNRPQPGGRTHYVNLVEVEGQTWVCDVGFGGGSFREPLALQPGIESSQLTESYCLRADSTHGFYLLRRSRGEWQPLYTFRIDPALPIDLEMANFYTSNSSDHIFRDAILGSRTTSRGRVTLSDHTFRTFDLVDGSLESEVITDFAAYVERLRGHLGVELSDDETASFRARFPALKPPAS